MELRRGSWSAEPSRGVTRAGPADTGDARRGSVGGCVSGVWMERQGSRPGSLPPPAHPVGRANMWLGEDRSEGAVRDREPVGSCAWQHRRRVGYSARAAPFRACHPRSSQVPQKEPPMGKPRASAVVAAQSSRIARPETFSVTAPYPRLGTHLRELREPEGPHWLEDVAYAQVRSRTVNIRANF